MYSESCQNLPWIRVIGGTGKARKMETIHIQMTVQLQKSLLYIYIYLYIVYILYIAIYTYTNIVFCNEKGIEFVKSQYYLPTTFVKGGFPVQNFQNTGCFSVISRYIFFDINCLHGSFVSNLFFCFFCAVGLCICSKNR